MEDVEEVEVVEVVVSGCGASREVVVGCSISVSWVEEVVSVVKVVAGASATGVSVLAAAGPAIFLRTVVYCVT